VVWVYAVFAIAASTVKFLDISSFVKYVLHVNAPERLITFGIAGAFVYLATSILNTINNSESKNDASMIASDYAIRFILAVVVPIVLVALFFSDDGKIQELKLTPDLLAFCCGYSAKLVITIFNKLVEKANKMVETI